MRIFEKLINHRYLNEISISLSSKSSDSLDYWTVIRHLKDCESLFSLRIGQDLIVVATQFEEIDPEKFKATPSNEPEANSLGTFGVISYDDYTPFQSSPSRFFKVQEGFFIEPQSGRIAASTKATRLLDEIRSNIKTKKTAQDFGPQKKAYENSNSIAHGSPTLPGHKPFVLRPLPPFNTTQQHESAIQKVIEEIKAGRFYQLNLLRYFSLTASRAQLIDQLKRIDAPYTGIVCLPDLELFSMSPERFFSIRTGVSGAKIFASPIKGTVSRGIDPIKDAQQAQYLYKSTKDRAELHMIVDLLRNDLAKICLRRRQNQKNYAKIRVDQTHRLLSTPYVHHLVADLSGVLDPRTNQGELLSALAPCGSITGAPKLEVINAIREYEQRPRGYFMGSLFYQDPYGNLDASVLIRTIAGNPQQNPSKFEDRTQNSYEFAAGGGIVVKSNPQLEAEEALAKCNVLTNDFCSPPMIENVQFVDNNAGFDSIDNVSQASSEVPTIHG